MCGIAGILQPGPSSFHQAELNKMISVLSHRGPDAEGSWCNPTGEVALIHRRLSVIDLSDNACQPFHYRNRYTVIHNGEIYNYVEIKERLLKEGYSFRSASDTEIIAASYDLWKEQCLDHFDGMFSFAIWDEQEKKLFAARDRFGEKPFFYHYNGIRFYFASEMKALWAAGLPRQPNLKLLFNFITIGYTGNPDKPAETFYENISKLPPASCLSCRPGETPLIKKYWSIDPAKTLTNITVNDAVEEFSSLLRLSIQRRLRSDVSLGSSLSGGLDSSAVLALVLQDKNQLLASTFQAFTAVFPGFEKDEFNYARQVAESKGIIHHTVEVTTENFAEEWPRMMYYQEEPAGSASIYPQYKVFELAAKHGVKVLLDGQGADEVLAGYPKYYKWYWQELFRKGKLYRSGELKAARKIGVTESFGIRNIIASVFPDLASVILEKKYLLRSLKQADLTKDFVRHQSGEAYYATPPYFNLNGVLHFNTCEYGLEELLRYADRNAMAHGREVRLPFLSHELVEFVFALPPHMKIRDGRTKWILRESVKNELPSSIVWRNDKVGFEPPQKRWMNEPVVQQMIREAKSVLIDEKILNRDVLNKPVIPRNAHDADNYDWRYLSSVSLFK